MDSAEEKRTRPSTYMASKNKKEQKENNQAGFATRALHDGQPPDPVTGAVCVPISLATTYQQTSPGIHSGYEYSRTSNPTRVAFEQCVASLEGAKYGVAFASGSAATAAILAMLATGDHVLSIDDVYGGTNRYFQRVAQPSAGLTFTFKDLTDQKELNAGFKDNTSLVWMETPTNPTLKVADIDAVVKATRIHAKHNKKDIICVVDNTFATPFFQNPLDYGCDLVVHSVTKYINGHSDVVMGVVLLNDDKLYERLRFVQNGAGAVPAPFDCYMAMRGVKTLAVRMERHATNALAVAQFLEKHDKVQKVLYPGLASHPQHATAKKQMLGFGGMVTFFLKGGITESRKFLENLNIFLLAESLGAVESLAEHPAIMTHASVPPAQRKLLGIEDNLIRLSVGIENLPDLIKDLTSALNAV